MNIRKFTKEERFGLIVTLSAHLIVFIFAYFMYSEPRSKERTAFIEITIGEFSDGTLAEFSREEHNEVATHPDPVEVETEEPTPEEAEVTEEIQPEAEEPTKDVDLADQEEEIEDEVVTTPDTDKVDPQLLTDEVEEQEEETAVEQKTLEDEIETEGEEESGDIRGIRGRMNADQGTANDPVRSSPYDLQWEGDINRSPVVQPLPSYAVDVEAVITIRFQVMPDGSVGRMQPLVRMNPELEREVFRALRRWRFSRLPSGIPQEPQWGTITFRFVLE